MNTWLIILGMGWITFALRLLPLLLLEGRVLPPLARRALQYIGPSVLAAIIATEILWPGGVLEVGPDNPRLWGGLAAALIAWRTRRVLWTIAGGMLVYWLIQVWL